jgi:hypothetical protein
VCKKRVSILTTEDSAPLRSRAIRRLVVIYLQNPVESPTVRHVKTIENIEVALPERFKLRSRNNRHMAGISLDLLIFYWEIR